MTTPIQVSDYQGLAARTLIDAPGFEIPDNEMMIIWTSLGLAGESGEVVELAKKGVFHRHGIDKERFNKELGDVLWYVASLCTVLELDMANVMQDNIDKLMVRYPNGYSPDDSRRRVDVKSDS